METLSVRRSQESSGLNVRKKEVYEGGEEWAGRGS
jgi:hypothetical protein